MEQQGVSWSRMEQHRAARSSMKQHGVSKNMDYHHRQLGNGYVHSSMNTQQQTISLLLFHKLYFSFVFLMLSFTDKNTPPLLPIKLYFSFVFPILSLSIKNAPSSHSQHYFSLSSFLFLPFLHRILPQSKTAECQIYLI